MRRIRPMLHIPHPNPLLPGKLLRRYNRFLADIELEGGGVITAHCVNTGRMEGLTLPGLRVWCSHDPSPSRKLQYTWQITEVEGFLIGTNTSVPNKIAGALIENRLIPGLDSWESFRPEAKMGERSRVDFLLQETKGLHFVEVKNCHLVYPDCIGYFPDSVSVRAAKHLEELAALVKEGQRASVLFTVQRTDVLGIRPSDVHDPVFAAAARVAASAGVRFHGVQVRPTQEALVVERIVPVDLEQYDQEQPRAWMTANRALAPAWQTVRRKNQEAEG